MLQALAIRDVVIIEQLDLVFGGHLGVLTGETGAGKSILLDALGLACGGRADRGLVRAGAEQAQASAVFLVPDDHPAWRLLEAAGLDIDDDTLVLRRTVQSDGRGRAFVNDQPVTTALLRSLATTLVEVHGQHDQHGLQDRSVQRDLLDAYGDHGALREAVAAAHERAVAALAARDRRREEVAKAARDEAYLRHRLSELEELAPVEGEEAALAERRARLLAHGKLQGGVDEALAAIRGPGGGLEQVIRAERALERHRMAAGELFEPALAALERARLELDESDRALGDAADALATGDGDLDTVEARLFALKDAARKHRTSGDGLVALLAETQRLLADLSNATTAMEETERALVEAERMRTDAVRALRRVREAAAERLAKAVARELPPLKLERVRIEVVVTPLEPDDWGAAGGERVEFRVATNPGQAAGPLGRIASGGELSRIMLAIKVVLARLGTAPTLIFDEIDTGIGGATADAVGERLARLGLERQVLVVTHAPQVAARAQHHVRVAKTGTGEQVTVEVAPLEGDARREEIARMLAGARVTQAARDAAQSLLAAES